MKYIPIIFLLIPLLSFSQNGIYDQNKQNLVSQADQILKQLRPLKEPQISTDPNVIPQGFAKGKYETLDSNVLILDSPNQTIFNNYTKSKTLLITIASIGIISLIIFGIFKSVINGKKSEMGI